MLDRLVSSLAALCLALLVWLYVRSRDQEILDNVMVAVQVALTPGQADQYELEVTGPSQVAVSFMGPPSRIRELRSVLQRGELHVESMVAVPADWPEESHYLDTVRVDATDVHPPPGVTPTILEGRNRIPITIHRLVERRLPVRLEHSPEERISQVVFEPANVLVRGPQDVLDHVRAIPAQPFSLPPHSAGPSGHEEVTAEAIPLVRELEGRHVRTVPEKVTAHLTFQPQQKVYELTDVPVQFLCPPNFPLRPLFADERAGKINLRILGPAGEEMPAVLAFIDLSGRKWEPGLYEESVKLQLPKEYQVAQNSPRLVAFQLTTAETTTKAAGVVRGP
ncbi:MAG TPA: hypothetical protein VK395_13750 [Gemmataceae bacterium]|nr:hypothetical protein [Gemmataceae bacterium]